MKHLGEGEEENQREQVIEKQHAAIAQRQPHVVLEQREVGFHSRRLFPVSSMKASSSDGRLMRMSASSTLFSSSHFDHLDHDARRAAGGHRDLMRRCIHRDLVGFAATAAVATIAQRRARVRSRWWNGPAPVPESRAACPWRRCGLHRRWPRGRKASRPLRCSAWSAGWCAARARRSSTSSWISRRACGSSPAEGSSRKSTCGSLSIASASASRCFWPPESLRV